MAKYCSSGACTRKSIFRQWTIRRTPRQRASLLASLSASETFPERAYIEWDFYKGDLAEKYHLVLNGVKVMTLKFWSNRKVGNEVIDDFKTLSDYAEKHYGIKTEKA